jgi:hypothetical protein
MNTPAVKSKYIEAKKKMEDLRKQIEEQAKTFFQEESKEIFAKHPDLERFSWTQYTPYFNDGDECVFGVNRDYIGLAMKDEVADVEDDEEEDFDDYETYDYVNGKKVYRSDDKLTAKQRAGRDVIAFLHLFEDEDYKTMFGNHVRVTVSRDGVSKDDYEHD